MSVFTYEAKELFDWLVEKKDIVIVDVRNDKDFGRFKVESPYPFEMLNIAYFDFMEKEGDAVSKVPKDKNIRIVCAKEGSAKYVADILAKHGFADVGYLAGGIKTWGNLLVPKLINEGMDYEIYQFIRPGKASCSYAIIYKNEMMLFDPSRNVDFYLQFAKDKNCKIIKSFETHLQADYIAGSRDISEKTGAEFLGNDNDFKDSKNNYISLVNGELHQFKENGPTVKVIFTPGHTPGSTSFMVDDKFMISGDMIFIESMGRPDLGGMAVEWAKMLFDSMLAVKKLSHSLIVLPGHYIDWNEANQDLNFICSLGDIIERNKKIYSIGSLGEFVDFIKDNMRKQPDEYAVIRMVNANIEHVDDERAEELDLGKNECAASAYAASQQQNR